MFSIRDARREDSARIGKLFVETDPENFGGAFGTEEAMGRYIESAMGGDGVFSAANIRVAEDESSHVIGICIVCSVPPEPFGKVVPDIDGLSESFGMAMQCQDDDTTSAIEMGYAYLDCLSVDESRRHEGIGTALLEDAKQSHDAILLYCRADNEPAKATYAKAGFQPMAITFGISEDMEELGPAMVMMAYGEPNVPASEPSDTPMPRP